VERIGTLRNVDLTAFKVDVSPAQPAQFAAAEAAEDRD